MYYNNNSELDNNTFVKSNDDPRKKTGICRH
jgi:hypothetical protein